MPKVPEYNLKPLKLLYKPPQGLATTKQKSLIITLYERRKVAAPDLTGLTAQRASTLIDLMLNYR